MGDGALPKPRGDCTDRVEVRVEIDTRTIRPNAVKKALYWLGERFQISVADSVQDNQTVLVTHLPEADVAHVRQLIERTLLDFELREIVLEQTSAVRAEIVSAALAPLRPRR